MKNKSFATLPFFLFALLSFFSAPAISAPLCKGCNVLFIAMDGLQASRVGHLGSANPTTPNIDALAKRGTSFATAISPASWTVPTYLSLFSSEYPSNHGLTNRYLKFSATEKILNNFQKENPKLLTLAETLRASGYSTGGFTGDAGISKVLGYDKGFDAYNDDVQFGGLDVSVPKANDWLEKTKGGKFFLFLHGYDSHGQYKLKEGYRSRFAPKEYSGKFKGTKEEQAALRETGLKGEPLNLTPEDMEFWRAWYDGKVADADERVGEFLEHFRSLGLDKKTVVVLTADHGTEFFEHGFVDHGHTLYDELIHVPLIISVPGAKGGVVVKQQVTTLDIMPTLLDILGIMESKELKKQIKGRSLAAALSGKKIPAKDVFSETDLRNFTHLRSIRSADGWKYVMALESGKDFLFDLRNDPGEKVNLVGSKPKQLAMLRGRLMKHLEKDLQRVFSASEATECLPVYAGQCQ